MYGTLNPFHSTAMRFCLVTATYPAGINAAGTAYPATATESTTGGKNHKSTPKPCREPSYVAERVTQGPRVAACVTALWARQDRVRGNLRHRKRGRLEQGPCRNTVVPRFTARAVPGRRDRGWVTLMMIHRTRRDATAGTSAGNWGNAPSGVWKSHSDRTRYASQSRAAALKDTVWKPSGPGISRRT